jgi:NitT/TauT family transport system substrate-binding protein
MQEDVSAVRTELIKDNPERVEQLSRVTQQATVWVNEHRDKTAEIIARQLQAAGEKISPEVEFAASLEITPEVISRSMDRIEYTTSINPKVIQDTIDCMVELGYMNEGIKAADIIDLTYLQKEVQDGGK